jgi:hypothetical protein
MALSGELKKALEKSELTYEELRAFEAGLTMLTIEEQEQFAAIITETPELVYPLYINFKAKLHAASGSEEDWENVIEQEIEELEEMISKRRVGNEVK